MWLGFPDTTKLNKPLKVGASGIVMRNATLHWMSFCLAGYFVSDGNVLAAEMPYAAPRPCEYLTMLSKV